MVRLPRTALTGRMLSGAHCREGMMGETAKDVKQPVDMGPAEEWGDLVRVFDALDDGIVIVNQARDLAYVNPMIESLYGPCKGMKCYRYFERGESPCADCPAEAVDRGAKSRMEWHCPKNDRTYDIITTPVTNLDGSKYRVQILRDITDQTIAMRQLGEQTRRLQQRIRELACLNAASALLTAVDAPIPEVLRKTADLLPPAMTYPERACARITLAGNVITTAGFKDTPWRISADIASAGEVLGTIEVFYDDGTPVGEDGPFLGGERDLLTMLAREVAGFIARRRDETAIAEHERILNLFLSASPDFTYLTDAEGKLIYANEASLRLAGLTLDEARQVNVFSRFATSHPAAPAGMDTEFRAGKEMRGFEVTVTLEGGKTIDLKINAVPVTVDGRVTQVLSVARDITWRKLAEKRLTYQLELLRTLMNTIPSPVFYKDTDGRYMGCNPAFGHFLGLAPEKIIGKSVYAIASKEDAEEHVRRDKDLLANPGAQSYEWQLRNGAGEIRDVIISKATFADPDGKVAGLVGIILDITDLKRTESALKKSGEAYRGLFEEAPIALVEVAIGPAIELVTCLASRGITDFQAHFKAHPDDVSALAQGYTISRANAAALSLNDCTTIDELGEVFRANIAGPIMEVAVGAMGAFLRGSGSFDTQHIAVTAKGRKRYFRTRTVAFPQRETSIPTVLIASVDITDLRETEGTLRQAQGQLRTYSEELEKMVSRRTERIQELERQRAASERIAATGRMAARIAHEINNPLAGIKNSFLLVKKAIPEDHPRFEYVELIEREISRVALIIRKMYELYRPEDHVRQPASVVESVQEVCSLLESSLREKEIDFHCNAPEPPVLARMPVGYLSQVMFNLLKNAIEASPIGGTVAVTVEQEDAVVVIRVKDKGSGILPEHRDRIFEPFFTTRADSDLHGLGLGLSITKSMIQAVSGTITFETSVGEGTEFTIRFPSGMEEDNA
jgi:PAS domain S-box-containing protein